MSTCTAPSTESALTVKPTFGAVFEGYHKAVKCSDGQTYHVFATCGSPLSGGVNDDDGHLFRVSAPFVVGPVSFELAGDIDLDSDTIECRLMGTVPGVGQRDLAIVDGDLKAGVSVSFEANGEEGVAVGVAKFYLEGSMVTVDVTADVFDAIYGPATIPLFQIPTREGGIS